MKSKASATWRGKSTEGKGSLTTSSNALKQVPYSYAGRYESGEGTTPEELVAAAYAGCFAMKLASLLEAEGFFADELNVDCEVSYEASAITGASLDLKAKIAGIEKDEFSAMVEKAGRDCPVSKLLNTKITLAAELI